MIHNHLPVGSVRIRTRHKRGGEKRAWVKVAEPNTWILRAHHVWIRANGEIPRGMVIHHRNDDKLDDDLANLEMITKAEHLAHHRVEFDERRIASSNKTRKENRWSTKSKRKRTGRHPARCRCKLHRARS